jgi:hypothetical protein
MSYKPSVIAFSPLIERRHPSSADCREGSHAPSQELVDPARCGAATTSIDSRAAEGLISAQARPIVGGGYRREEHPVLGGRIQLEASGETAPSWRRWLVYSLGTALLIKLVALLVIKSAFFSAAREPDVTPQLVDEQLAVEPRTPPQPAEESPR